MENILSRHTIDQLFSLDNVAGIGYGFKEIRGRLTDQEAIVVMVKKKMPLSKLNEHQVVPEFIEGIISDVLEVGQVSIHRARYGFLPSKAFDEVEEDISRQSRWRPAPGGVSIGHYKITAGTLGSVVYDKSTGRRLILSNNHVLANSTNGEDNRARIGDPILQPGPLDGGTVKNDTIAKLYRFVPLNDKGCNLVDAAVAKPLKARLVTRYILRVGTVKGKILPKLGMRVKKSGRTTGLTQARIRAIHVMTEVDYDGRILIFKDQILTNKFDEPGDSGSLVLNEYNWAVGLLFAGSEKVTIINPIDPVLDLLGIRF